MFNKLNSVKVSVSTDDKIHIEEFSKKLEELISTSYYRDDVSCMSKNQEKLLEQYAAYADYKDIDENDSALVEERNKKYHILGISDNMIDILKQLDMYLGNGEI